MSKPSLEERFATKPRRTVLGLGISAVLILGTVGAVGSLFSLALNPLNQAARLVHRTLDAENVIANYEWFKRQVEDVNAIDEKIAAAKAARQQMADAIGPRQGWQFDDRQEWGRLSGVVLGLENQRASMVAEYNARTKMLNRDIFRTADLPEQLR